MPLSFTNSLGAAVYRVQSRVAMRYLFCQVKAGGWSWRFEDPLMARRYPRAGAGVKQATAQPLGITKDQACR
ncbi:hypothetical protein [Pseudomonas sp. Bi70]|uniref:hypothetical protein n=1 Tax=Pseudomonas sp. Bi70 TaxID=2821127 RepID=UPI001E55FE23|nr:hypothetical protein [Pseudomonas sp. Bi70]